MKKLKIINLILSNGKEKIVYFGQPDQTSELEETYKFRNDQYIKRGYIEKGFYPDGRDYDELDRKNKCEYFIAKVDDRLIGTLRLIMDDYLPTETECFDFAEPKAIKRIPRNKRAEIGRLIVSRYCDDIFFPRHIIMLGLLMDAFNYCQEQHIQGGYSFIKDKLRKKFKKILFPIHVIKEFEQIYNLPTLHNYFSDPQDTVWPIYYLSREVQLYFRFLSAVYLGKKSDNEYYIKKMFR